MKRTLAIVALGALALSGCKKEEAADTTDNAEAVVEATAKVVETPAEEPKTELEAPAPSEATVALLKTVEGGEAITVAQIQDSFKVDGAAWMGKKIKVKGLYLNTNSVKSGDAETHNIVIVDEKSKLKPSITCDVAEKPEGLMQYTAIVAEGTVDKMFGAQLKDCSFSK